MIRERHIPQRLVLRFTNHIGLCGLAALYDIDAGMVYRSESTSLILYGLLKPVGRSINPALYP